MMKPLVGVMWAYITICWICNAQEITTYVPQASKEEVTITCGTTTAALKEQVFPCLKKGEKFLKIYFKKYERQNFNRCGEFEQFAKCINPILKHCPVVKERRDIIPKEWLTTIELMNCACKRKGKGTRACASSLNCMEDEMQLVFSQRCDNTYELNLEQGTQDTCHFLTEYVHCKDNLVRSGCGQAVGTLFYLAHKVAAWNTFSCDIRRWPEYGGFAYNAQCPRDLSQNMDDCMEKSLSAKVLRFIEANDLIPDENAEAIDLACRAYHNYKKCLAPLNESCPTGVQSALNHEGNLRLYLMKMEYFCDIAKENYINHVECYQKVQENDYLSFCMNVWTKIDSMLGNMTAFKFYCQREDKDTVNLESELDNIRLCYEDIIKKKCSENGLSKNPEEAATAMGNLITKAFMDPFYLRLDYIPDCTLHTMESLTKRVEHQKRHKHDQRNKHKDGKRSRSVQNNEFSQKKEIKTGHSYQRGSGNTLHRDYFMVTLPLTALSLMQVTLYSWLPT